jgi:hypothetical protein
VVRRQSKAADCVRICGIAQWCVRVMQLMNGQLERGGQAKRNLFAPSMDHHVFFWHCIAQGLAGLSVVPF